MISSRNTWSRLAAALAVALALLVAIPATGQKTAVRKKPKTEATQKAKTGKKKTTTATKKKTSSAIATSRTVDLGLSVRWAGFNVGAASPEEYGGLYGWGDATGMNRSISVDDYPCADPPACISGTSYDIARANWGGSWRLPTCDELLELKQRCTWTWTTYRGVRGYKVTGPSGKSIFLPAGGDRFKDDTRDRGDYGSYWSGDISNVDTSHAQYIYFKSDIVAFGSNYRPRGRSVRPVTD